jgi:hypothetical protein
MLASRCLAMDYFNCGRFPHIYNFPVDLHREFECTKHNPTNNSIVHISSIRGQYTYCIKFIDATREQHSYEVMAVMAVMACS